MKSSFKNYTELLGHKTFLDRFHYLKLFGSVGESTFGFDRWVNQQLYTSRKWKQIRDQIIIRDNGCDMAIDDYQIGERIIIHHMNPLTIEDIEFGREIVYDPEFLVCVSFNTHNAVHYGDESLLPIMPVERRPNDTIPWR